MPPLAGFRVPFGFGDDDAFSAAYSLTDAAVAEDEADRGAIEPERLAQAVLEIASVREVDRRASEAKNTNVGGAIAAWVA